MARYGSTGSLSRMQQMINKVNKGMNNPTANLKIVSVEKKKDNVYIVNASITIKNITQQIVFETKIEKNRAFAKLVIDRTEFGIIYKSGNFFEEIADKAIYDEFEMTIELAF